MILILHIYIQQHDDNLVTFLQFYVFINEVTATTLLHLSDTVHTLRCVVCFKTHNKYVRWFDELKRALH